MEKAIKRAIEGGWKPTSLTYNRRDTGDVYDIDDWNKTLLDHTFWQCLGKAEGWKLKKDLMLTHDDVFMFGNDKIDEWEYKQLLFIHHLAKGKSVDDFFNQLLK